MWLSQQRAEQAAHRLNVKLLSGEITITLVRQGVLDSEAIIP